MKKHTLLMLWLALATCATQAQTVTPSDTLVGRCDYYYYDPLNESCPWFQQSSTATYRRSGFEENKYFKLVRIEHTDRRMAVKGIAAMVTRPDEYLAENDWVLFNSPNPGKKAEYVYLGTADTHILTIRDSVRWDTLTPRLWKFPTSPDSLTSADPDSFLCCHLFEAYFDQPLLVDSTFLLAGSFYSNNYLNPKTYFPTRYYFVAEDYDICNLGCHGDTTGYLYTYTDTSYLRQIRDEAYAYYDSIGELEQYKDSIDYYLDQMRRFRIDRATLGNLGPFFAIVDFYQLDVTSDDRQKGWGLGSGRYPDRSFDTISARPRPGFCFVRWSDGNTDNPRIIELTQDTLFTALFDTCTVQDIATPDGPPLPFSVIPNPTTGNLTVSTPADGSYQVALYDMAGRCLLQTAFNGTAITLNIGTLASGNYQLALRSATASGIKVIVKQ